MDQKEWIALAEQTIPKLPEYYGLFRNNFDPETMLNALEADFKASDWNALHSKFNNIWAALPEREDIRVYPFSDLCDLCSEYLSWS